MLRAPASRAGVTGWNTGSRSAGRSSAARLRRSAVSSRPGDLVQVVGRERPGGRLLLLAELRQQQLAERRRHRGVDLDPHHLGEAPVAHFFLDQAQQVFGLVAIIDLEVGVAGDPEGVPAEDLDARETAPPGSRRSPPPAARSGWASAAAPSGAGSWAPSPARTAPRRRCPAAPPPARGSGSRCRGTGVRDRPRAA